MSELTVSKERNILTPNNVTFEERRKQLKQQEEKEIKESELKKKSSYTKFYQINIKHADDLIWLSLNAPKARAILDFLLSHMDGYNALVCSYKAIQEALDISRTTAYEAIKVLTQKGFIYVAKTGNSTVFYVNDDLAWKSWGNNKKYCEFPAHIILSASENSKLSQKCKSHKAITIK